jgi:large repetitive protein
LTISDAANGLVEGAVYNDIDKSGDRKITNPNNLAPYAGVEMGDRFAENYKPYNLGLPNGLPGPIGPMVFMPDDPDTVLIGGGIRGCGGSIYKVKVQRGEGGHIIGFDDDNNPDTPYVAEFYAYAPYLSGMTYAPDGSLITTNPKYSPVAGIGFVPDDLPGAGELKGTGKWPNTGFYDLSYLGSGQYNNPVQTGLVEPGSGSFIYRPVTAPDFAGGPEILIVDPQSDRVLAYEIDSHGNPIANTVDTFMKDFDWGVGAVVDPRTGDLLFSSAGNENTIYPNNTILAVRGLGPLTGNEPGLAGTIVYVDQDQDGIRDAGEDYTTTDAFGRYSFTLTPGTYQIRQELTQGWTQTQPQNPLYREVVVVANKTVYEVNFGNYGAPKDAANLDPSILSTANLNAITEERYLYNVKATDLNGDALTYELVVKPEGMAIAPNGTISWRPNQAQVGSYQVVVRVTDGKGGLDLQTFDVAVAQGNRDPIITSQVPDYNPTVGKTYQYQVTAKDLDGDGLTYSLLSNPYQPSGVTIDAQTGVLKWNPTAAQTGGAFRYGDFKELVAPWQVTVKVTDGKGGESYQSLNLIVDPAQANRAPMIESQPRTQARVGQGYIYDIQAKDLDGDALTYTLVKAPQGMSVSNGIISWLPTADQSGSQEVILRVSDGKATVEQTWTIAATNQLVNYAPTIASSPSLVTNVGDLYSYDLKGSDADNDAIVWSLNQAPLGMLIDAQTGALRWQPTEDQIGTHEVTVQVADTYGALSTQTFTLKVTGINAPPEIVSVPPTRGAIGQGYSYKVVATDPEKDTLTFNLGQKPAGMTINAQTGVLSWKPAANQVGTHTVEIQVIDAEGAVGVQTYKIEVGTTAINLAPEITSIPGLFADTTGDYQYQVQARDPEGDAITYQLLEAPQGMTIDPLTGLVNWDAPQTGTHQVVVGAIDPNGLGTAQAFTLNAKANSLPVIRSTPGVSATPLQEYKYDLQASDPDGGKLTYSLDASSQSLGMAIDSLGRLRWTPTFTQLGIYPITLTITDEAGAKVTQQFNLTVTADTEAPKVSLIGSTNIADIGDNLFFQARATDNVGIQNLQLFINDQPVAIDGNGLAQLTAEQSGPIVAKAVAIDLSGNRTETITTIQVIDPTDTDAPQIDLDLSGITDGVITAPTKIRGTVTDTNLDYYVLEVAPLDGSAGFKEVFRGSAIVSDGILGTFDPSLLQNDTYILRLTAYDTNGQGTTTESTIAVAGELKLGNFRLSFTDLTIPVIGIPITVTRTYDTLTSNNTDDFGYGWRMEFRDTDLRTSLGKDEQYEIFGIKSKGFKEDTRVYITLPGGKREAFTFKPTINRLSGFLGYAASQGGVSGFDTNLYNPAFEADKGVTSTLSVRNPESSGNMLSRNLDTGMFRNLGGQLYDPADPYFGGIYILTTKEGIEYEIDGKTGDLLKVTDTNGNVLTFSDTEIKSSTGQQVTFERDAQNRITAVIDPMGNRVKYEYDAKGDLTGVTDREGNTTRYEYDETQAHYLDKIIDPLGRMGVRNEYGDDGKLKKIFDANGNAVEMLYDPNNSIQKVKDVLGNETVYEHDQRGNVVTEIDAEGKVTRRSYDASNNVLTETIITTESGPQGWTTSYTYDSDGNQLSRTNALGDTEYYTYDARGNLLSTTDALGNTTRYTYTTKGQLRSKTDATGHITSYRYDQWGNVIQRTEGTNDVTSYEYDNQGNKTKETDALGNITTFEYDANGNATKETKTLTTENGIRTLTVVRTYTSSGKVKTVVDAEGGLTQYDYDANGNQTVIIDPLGRRTEMKYDDKNQLLETILPDATPNDLSDNPRVRYSYDASGNKLSIIDQDGDATLYSYNSQKLPTGMVLPDDTPDNLLDNADIDVAYTSAGWLKTLVKNGIRTEFEHDAVGRITLTRVIRDGQAFETRTTYDANGNKIAETDPLNRTTRYTYDAVGRLTSTTYPDGTSTSTVYNYAGKAIAQTDQAGRITKYEYDALDRLTAVVDPTGQRMEYRYNELGSLIEQKDANGHITRYEYDGLGRPTATLRPMGQRSETQYGAAGRVIKTIDFNGEIITYSYDAQNRLIGKNFVSDEEAIAFTYTHDGHRETVTDIRGTTRYAYNTQGQLLSRTEPDGSVISYTYDSETQKVKTVTSLSGTTSYEYNDLAQLTKVTSPDGEETLYTYDAVGNLATTVRPNGTTQTYRYDALNRVVYLENKNASGQILTSYTYTYDQVGNKTSVEEYGGRKVNYTYDALNRLTQEAIMDAVNGDRTIEYVYDVAGNRISRNDSVEGLTTYTYDENDRLLTETKAGITTTHSYDKNGNLIAEQSPDKTVIYDWNSGNRLVGAVIIDATGMHQLQYLYDENGIRVAAIVDGQETRYVVDSNRQYAQVLEEYNASGVSASYVYGNELVSQTRVDDTFYYLYDGHSGVRGLTDKNGAIVSTYAYDAYGNLLQKTGDTQNDYLYRGEQVDQNLDMQYLRARYYDQDAGRFVSTDPFGGWQVDPLSRHRYIYGHDNPLKYADPTGFYSTSLTELSVRSTLLAVLESLAIAAGIQLATNLSTRRIQGDIVWRGELTGFNAGVKLGIGSGITGTVLDATTLTEESTYAFGLLGRKQYYSGKWLQLSIGADLGDLLGGLSSGEAISEGLTIRSPRVWGANPGVLLLRALNS